MKHPIPAVGARARRLQGTARVVLALACLVAAAVAAANTPPPVTGLSGVINVNTATAEELTLLPGVGEARAQAIVELRKERGRFERVDQLAEVKGIGQAMLERLRPHLALDGKSTLQRREP